jgi:hypothetical protein
MKNFFKYMLPVLLTSLLFACKEEKGCTDKTALNYNAEAEVNDGSCEYMSSIKLAFQGTNNNQKIQLNVPFMLSDSTWVNLTTFRFYVSNVELTNATGEVIKVGDVGIIDLDTFKSPVSSFHAERFIKVDTKRQNFIKVKFDLGVAESVNFTDPTTYANTHPLGVQLFQHWSWSTGYIFIKMEGSSDTDRNGVIDMNDANFLIHTGTTPLYRSNVSIEKNVSMQGNGTDEFTVNINFAKVFRTPGNTIDLSNAMSHTMNNMPLAVQFSDLMVNAFE